MKCNKICNEKQTKKTGNVLCFNARTQDSALKKSKINIQVVVILLFVFSTAVRFFLALKAATVSIIYDELLYWDMSKSIYLSGSVMFRNLLISNKDIVYSLVISWVHSFENTDTAYHVMLLCNSTMMSSAVFPVYLLAKEVLQNRKTAVVMAIVSILLPEMFYTTRILQENIYYPLMMWVIYLFVKYIFPDRYNWKKIVACSMILTLMGYVKNIGLCILFGLALFYFIYFLIENTKWNKLFCVAAIAEIAVTYLILKKILDMILNMFLVMEKGDSIESLENDALSNILQIGKYKDYINPIASYAFYGILTFGVFTIIVDLAYLKYLNDRDKALLLYLVCCAVVTLGVVCVLIIDADMEIGVRICRVHMRYFYYFFIPVFILFFKLYGTVCSVGLNKECTGIAIAYILLTMISPSEVAVGSTIDAIAIDSLRAFFMTAFRQKCLKVIIIIGIIFGCWLIYKKYIKILYICVCVMLAGLSFHSTGKAYSTSIWEKEALTEMVNDGERLTEALKDHVSDIDDVLIIASNHASTGVMETRLEIPYRVCEMELFQNLMLQNSEELDYDQLIFQGLKEYSLEDYKAPEFIIVQGELEISGYELYEEIGLRNFKLYIKDVRGVK